MLVITFPQAFYTTILSMYPQRYSEFHHYSRTDITPSPSISGMSECADHEIEMQVRIVLH